MGLSKDPVKRRRQLEALALGAERRAANLRARIAADVDEPGSSEAVSEAVGPPVGEADSEARIEAPASAGIVPGRYREAPSAAVVPIAEPAEPEPDPEPDQEPELELEPAEAKRGRGVSLAAAALGVKPRS